MASAQKENTYTNTDAESYRLYKNADWAALIDYGKAAIENGQDFILLRLRIAYAYFMRNNFSGALAQYSKVLEKDSYNETAHYYSWLCHNYLNQSTLAGTHAKFISAVSMSSKKTSGISITSVGIEYSAKIPDHLSRDYAQYARFDIANRWSANVHMDQSVALFNQKLAEPLLNNVNNNFNISIEQKEYYNKLTINLQKRWQLKLAGHYFYTPFNNFTYDNYGIMAGVRFYGNYFDVQADVVYGRVTDTTQQQYNVQVSTYPLGNLNLYTITTGIYRQRNGTNAANLKQVLGGKLFKNVWLEGNVTLGRFSNLFENDALYAYNAIDPNTFKAGGTVYVVVAKKLTLQAGYTFEQRALYKRTILFNQHSITGGVSCKF